MFGATHAHTVSADNVTIADVDAECVKKVQSWLSLVLQVHFSDEINFEANLGTFPIQF